MSGRVVKEGLSKYINLKAMKAHDQMCILGFNPNSSQKEVPKGEKSGGTQQWG